MTHDNKLQVEAIKRGTVIDHIPAQVGFKLLTLFKLTETDQRITIGLNLPSGFPCEGWFEGIRSLRGSPSHPPLR